MLCKHVNSCFFFWGGGGGGGGSEISDIINNRLQVFLSTQKRLCEQPCTWLGTSNAKVMSLIPREHINYDKYITTVQVAFEQKCLSNA